MGLNEISFGREQVGGCWVDSQHSPPYPGDTNVQTTKERRWRAVAGAKHAESASVWLDYFRAPVVRAGGWTPRCIAGKSP